MVHNTLPPIVTVAVDAVVYYRINNPMMSVTNVDDCTNATRLLAQTTLRNILGTHDLASILSEREEISNAMQVSSHPESQFYELGFGLKLIRPMAKPWPY